MKSETEITAAVWNQLSRLQVTTGSASIGQTICRMATVYASLVEAVAAGAEALVRRRDGTLDRVDVLPNGTRLPSPARWVRPRRRQVTRRRIGLAIGWLALPFCLAETWYFGWNHTAHSTAERVCDCIVLAMLVVGIIAASTTGDRP